MTPEIGWVFLIGFFVVAAMFLHASYMVRCSHEREQVLRDWIDKLLGWERDSND